MAGTGRLELSFVDVNGSPIHDSLDIRLSHHVLQEEVRVDAHDASKTLALAGLRTEPQGLHVLEVRGRAYWPVKRFVTIASSGPTRHVITLPIRPDRARAIFPDYDHLDQRVRDVLERSNAVRGHEGLTGHALYRALSDEAKAGLLNIAKKTLATQFKDGADLLRHTTLRDILGDRCFVEVPPVLSDRMPEYVDREIFRAVDGSLHEAPEAGFVPAGSFKTLDAFGNLQMTFFKKDARAIADVDIDDAAGLPHVFQVMRNHLTGSPTHPYNIHQILVAHQHLDPGYRLVPRTA
jgi:hypothetical protein